MRYTGRVGRGDKGRKLRLTAKSPVFDNDSSTMVSPRIMKEGALAARVQAFTISEWTQECIKSGKVNKKQAHSSFFWHDASA